MALFPNGATIKGRVIASFPATVTGTGGISVTKENGHYTISVDQDTFPDSFPAVRWDLEQFLGDEQREQARENIAAVGYDAQTLADEQKEQARENIEAQRKVALHLADYCEDLSSAGVDITAGLQAAIDALPAEGGTIYVPATPAGTGFWTISSAITIGDGASDGSVASTLRAVRIKGAGSGGLYGTRGSYLRWSGAAGGTFFQIKGPIENVEISGLNINGNNSAAILLDIGAMRFSRLHDIYGNAFTEAGIKLYGLPTTAALNVMLDFSYLYFTTNQPNAIPFDLDGVLVNSTDTWLSTVSNSRFESTGTNGVAIRCGFSDNILWSQIHAIGADERLLAVTGDITSGSPTVLNVTPTTDIAVGAYITGTGIPAGTKVDDIVGSTITLTENATATTNGLALIVVAGCGVLFDASTSGSLGNSFPTGHLFVKSAIDNTHVIEDASHTIGVNNFVDFGTTDLEDIPTHVNLRGVTDQGVSFNDWGAGIQTLAAPANTRNNGPALHYFTDTSGSVAQGAIQAHAGAGVFAVYSVSAIPTYFGANSNATGGGRVNADLTTDWFEIATFFKDIKLKGSTSGTGSLKAPAISATYAWTLPAATTTLVGTDTTQTLTNKSIDAAQLTGTIDNARTDALSGVVTKSAGSGTTTWTAEAWTSYVPTLTFNGGTIGTGNTIAGRYYQIGKTVHFTITVTMGASGVSVAGSSIGLTLPLTALSSGTIGGINSTQGKSLAGRITGGTTNLTVWLYDATFPVANSNVLYISGTYEAQ